MNTTNKHPELHGCNPIQTQRATNSSNNAIAPATIPQQGSLKGLVEQRFLRNTPRNSNATANENTRNSTTIKHGHLVAPVAPIKNAPVVGVEIEQDGLVDVWGRKQCLSCESWKFQRCNNSANTVRDNWDGVIHFLPNPDLWWRCELHSINKELIEGAMNHE